MLYTDALSPRYPYRRLPTSSYRAALSVHEFLCSRVQFFDYPNFGIHFPASNPYRLYVSQQYTRADEYNFIRNHLYCGDLRPGVGGSRPPATLRVAVEWGQSASTSRREVSSDRGISRNVYANYRYPAASCVPMPALCFGRADRVRSAGRRIVSGFVRSIIPDEISSK